MTTPRPLPPPPPRRGPLRSKRKQPTTATLTETRPSQQPRRNLRSPYFALPLQPTTESADSSVPGEATDEAEAVPISPSAPVDVRQLTASDLFLFPFSTSITSSLCSPPGCAISFVSDFLSPLAIRLLHAELAAVTTWQSGTLHGNPLPRVSCWFAPSTIKYAARKWPFFPHPPVLLRVQTLLTPHLREHLGINSNSRPFQGVLVNKYRSGFDSMGAHADDEGPPEQRPTVVSVNLGVTRTFCMARKEKEAGEKRRKTIKYELNEGSLLLMGGETQAHYLHWVPKQPERVGLRYNLTFRDWWQ